jgi:hypothetical protein
MPKAARKSKPSPLELLTGQALVDAIAAEVDDGCDCMELEEMHAAQRRAQDAAMSDTQRVWPRPCALLSAALARASRVGSWDRADIRAVGMRSKNAPRSRSRPSAGVAKRPPGRGHRRRAPGATRAVRIPKR